MTVRFDQPYSHSIALKHSINLSIYEQLASSRYLHAMEREKTISPSRWPAWLNAAAFLVASFYRAIVRTALLVLRPDDHNGMTRLREAGAWLAMDPQAIAACFAK